PAIRRFISSDSYGLLSTLAESGDINMFAYCGNNPVMCVDPSGCAPEWLSGIGRIITGIGAVIAGVLVFASSVALVPMLIVAGVTVAAGALTVANGVADIQQSITGNNFIRDGLFDGEQTAYNIYASIMEGIAIIGSIVCGGWLKVNYMFKY
ncbi:MAG: hypothetical protein E7667_07010, partial [Ruminococcaceae bacterium]|nr:hypothetical protein [Oscillospiraceae bacterium]